MGNDWRGTLIQLDPKTGAVLGSYGSDVTLGLVADPNSSKLYVATGQGVATFDTQSLTFSSFSKTRVEGLALAPDGTLWGVEWPNNHRLVTFDRRGRATVRVDLETNALALVFGAPKTQLDGLLFVSSADGDLFAIDAASLQSTVIASGGKRGAFLAASADGRLYLGGTDGIDVVYRLGRPW